MSTADNKRSFAKNLAAQYGIAEPQPELLPAIENQRPIVQENGLLADDEFEKLMKGDVENVPAEPMQATVGLQEQQYFGEQPTGFDNFARAFSATEKGMRSGMYEFAGQVSREHAGDRQREDFVKQIQKEKQQSAFIPQLKDMDAIDGQISKLQDEYDKNFSQRQQVTPYGATVMDAGDAKSAAKKNKIIDDIAALNYRKKMIQEYGDLDTAVKESSKRLADQNTYAAKAFQKADELRKAAPYFNPDSASGFIGSVIPSTLPSLAAVAAAPFTSGSSLAVLPWALGIGNMIALTSSSAGSAIADYKDYMEQKGLETDDATMWKVGIAHGALEAVAESIRLPRFLPKGLFAKSLVNEMLERGGINTIDKMLSEYTQRSGGNILRKYGKELLKQGKEEGLEEVFTEIGQELSNTLYQAPEDQKGWKEIAVSAARAGAAGFMSGMFIGGARSATLPYMQRQARKANGGVTLAEVTDDEMSKNFPVVEIIGQGGNNFSAFTPSGEQIMLNKSQIGQIETIPIKDFNNYQDAFQKNKSQAAEIAKEIEATSETRKVTAMATRLAESAINENGKYVQVRLNEKPKDGHPETETPEHGFVIEVKDDMVLVMNPATMAVKPYAKTDFFEITELELTPEQFTEQIVNAHTAQKTIAKPDDGKQAKKIAEKLSVGMNIVDPEMNETIEITGVERLHEGFVSVIRTNQDGEEVPSELPTDMALDLFGKVIDERETEKAPIKPATDPTKGTIETKPMEEAPAVMTEKQAEEAEKPQLPVKKDGTPDIDKMTKLQLFEYNKQEVGEEEALKDLESEVVLIDKKISDITEKMATQDMKGKAKARQQLSTLNAEKAELEGLRPVVEQAKEEVKAETSQEPIQQSNETTTPQGQPQAQQAVATESTEVQSPQDTPTLSSEPVGGTETINTVTNEQDVQNAGTEEQLQPQVQADEQQPAGETEQPAVEQQAEPVAGGVEQADSEVIPDISLMDGASDKYNLQKTEPTNTTQDAQPTQPDSGVVPNSQQPATTDTNTPQAAAENVSFQASDGETYTGKIVNRFPSGSVEVETPDGEVWRVDKDKFKVVETGAKDAPQALNEKIFGEKKEETSANPVEQAAAQVNTEPTDPQKEAGNYKKGHVKINGFDITIENPKGSTRSGTDKDGKSWSVEMKNHYGYFKRTNGKDGDQIDTFIGENIDSPKVFVVDQNNDEGVFDESKVMLGFDTAEQAQEAYMSNYSPGWKGFGSITETTVDDFKKWLYDGAKQRKAFAEYKDTPEPLSPPDFAGTINDGKTPKGYRVVAEQPDGNIGFTGWYTGETIEAIKADVLKSGAKIVNVEEGYESDGYIIYPTKVKGADGKEKEYFGLQSEENKNKGRVSGAGNQLFDSLDAAKKGAAEQRQQTAIDTERTEKETLAKQQAQQAEAARIEANKGKSGAQIMQEARANKVLSTLTSHNGMTKTRKQFIEDLINDGYKLETAQVQAIKDLTRQAYNRMDNRQQEEFERRQREAGMKTEYRIVDDKGAFYTITKTEYDYGATYKKPDQVVEGNETMEDKPTKQPWDMTRDEWRKHKWAQLSTGAKKSILNKERGFATEDEIWEQADNEHLRNIQQALSEGKPVPAEVLKDYPELQKESGGVSPAPIETGLPKQSVPKLTNFNEASEFVNELISDFKGIVETKRSKTKTKDVEDGFIIQVRQTTDWQMKTGRVFSFGSAIFHDNAQNQEDFYTPDGRKKRSMADITQRDLILDFFRNFDPLSAVYQNKDVDIQKLKNLLTKYALDENDASVKEIMDIARARIRNAENIQQKMREKADKPASTDPASLNDRLFGEKEKPTIREIADASGGRIIIRRPASTPQADTPKDPQPKEVDVEKLFGSLKETGEAKLSDNLKPTTTYGADNKIVSKDRYEELKKRMQDKLNNLNVGFDPEILAIGTEMAAFHIEAGARTFNDFARNMIDELGAAIKPYLKSIYNGARDMPGMEELSGEMTEYSEVSKTNVNEIKNQNEESGRSTETIESETEAIEREAENVRDAATAAAIDTKIDAVLTDLNLRLNQLGYSTAGINHERPNVEIAKRIKKDVTKFSKELAKTLGWEHGTDFKGKKTEYANSNIAPAGGDASFTLWSPDGKTGVYISIPYNPDYNGGYDNYKIGGLMSNYGGSDNTVLWRITIKETSKGKSRESNLDNRYAPKDVTIGQLSEMIKQAYESHTGQKAQPKAPVTPESLNEKLFGEPVKNLTGNEKDSNLANENSEGNETTNGTDGSGTLQRDEAGLPETVGNTGTETGVQGDSNAESGIGDAVNESSEETKRPEQNGNNGDREQPTGSSGGTTGGNTGRTERTGDRNTTGRNDVVKNSRNLVINKGDNLIPRGDNAKIKANIDAIKLAKKLNGEPATPAQMEVLKRYIGWGGLSSVFKRDHQYYEDLKKVLNQAEYESARESTTTSFYTPVDLIDTIWTAVKKLGFKGGNVLDPSAGIGHFYGVMPQDIRQKSNLSAIELDEISGLILKSMYPDSKNNVAGFEDVQIPNNSLDLVITNVPFGTFKLHDSKEKDISKFNIHDFFIAKSIRKLKPGGLGVFVTTTSTLDRGDELRRWLANEGNADVIDAFRLNTDTFKSNSGTEASSDIIIIRKRDNTGKSVHAKNVLDTVIARQATYTVTEKPKNYWQSPVEIQKTATMTYNKFFVENPNKIAGEMKFGFEGGNEIRPTEQRVAPVKSKDQGAMLEQFINQLPELTLTEQTNTNNQTEVDVSDNIKEGGLMVADNVVYIIEDGTAVLPDWNTNKVNGYTKTQVVNDYIKIKDAVNRLIEAESENIGDVDKLRKDLNNAYDTFVDKVGTLNNNVRINFLTDDVDFPAISALENVEEKTEIEPGAKKVDRYIVTKSDIFSKRVVGGAMQEKAESIDDAINLSRYKKGKLNTEYASNLLNMDEQSFIDQALKEGKIFKNPDTGVYESKEDYLSGNVIEKMKKAEQANQDNEYNNNIEELKKVIPTPVPMQLIKISLGSTWIPDSIYNKFFKEAFGFNPNIKKLSSGRFTANLKDGGGNLDISKGMEEAPGSKIAFDAMNNKATIITKREYNYDSRKYETRKDDVATMQAAMKQSELSDEFESWIKKQYKEAIEQLETIYNEIFNAVVEKVIDVSSFETFPNATTTKIPRQHQKEGVMRALFKAVMLAHEVGTGKTITLISTAMEMRRLGLAKKPVIVVQRSTYKQFVNEIKSLYPGAKVLVPSSKDLTAAKRKQLFAKIAYNDWDIVVLYHSYLDSIPDDPTRIASYIQEKIEEKLELIGELRESGDPNSKRIESQLIQEIKKLEDSRNDAIRESIIIKEASSIKQKEKSKKTAETRAKSLVDRKTDDVFTFEQLGVDALLIDEAHAYKKLGFATNLQNIKGVDTGASKRAQSLRLKTSYILDNNNGRNVVLATGTPISNTMAEMWTFLRYLLPKEELSRVQMNNFDAFVNNFGEIEDSAEFSTSGKFKILKRFSKYSNIPELQSIWKQVAHTVLTEEIATLKAGVGTPNLAGGKPTDTYLPQTTALKAVMKSIKQRIEEFEKMTGREKKENSHIPLVMFGLAKQAAIDVRIVVPDAPDDHGSKLNETVRIIMQKLQESNDYKGTIAVFSDSYQSRDKSFNVFEDIKKKLVAFGIKPEQVAIINDYKTDDKKERLFKLVNSGEVRVILGTTEKLGVGVNIQERLNTLIHMDAPIRPSDYQQRNGRILRQGNLHLQMGIPVNVIRLGVEKTLDVTGYQRLKIKDDFIKQIMKSDNTDRSIDEIEVDSVDSSNFSHMMASLSGSSSALALELEKNKYRKLRNAKIYHETNQMNLASKINDAKNSITFAKSMINAGENLLNENKLLFGGNAIQSITSGKNVYNTEEQYNEFMKLVEKAIDLKKNELRADVTSMEASFDYPMKVNGVTANMNIKLEKIVDLDSKKVKIYTNIRIDKFNKNFANPENIFKVVNSYVTGSSTIEEVERYKRGIVNYENDIIRFKSEIGKPFDKSEQLSDSKEKIASLEAMMKEELAAIEAEEKAANIEAIDIGTIEEDDGTDDTDETSDNTTATKTASVKFDKGYVESTMESIAKRIVNGSTVESIQEVIDTNYNKAASNSDTQLLANIEEVQKRFNKEYSDNEETPRMSLSPETPVSETGFYSTVENALNTIKQDKGTQQQFKAMLLKNGAKQSEMDWMGWDEFVDSIINNKFNEGQKVVSIQSKQLGDKTKYSVIVDGELTQSFFDKKEAEGYARKWDKNDKSITKADIQQWIDQNRIEVEEVKKGASKAEVKSIEPVSEKYATVFTVTFSDNSTVEVDLSGKYDNDPSDISEREIAEEAQKLRAEDDLTYEGDEEISPTKFSQYQLPGGENYKELLLTMPEKRENVTYSIIDDNVRYGGNYKVKNNVTGEEILGSFKTKEAAEKWIKGQSGSRYSVKDNFKSSHFDEPNILAHIRFNERTVNGERVLFIEEIQSDWAQKGKKEGFRSEYKIGDKINTIFGEGSIVEIIGDKYKVNVKGSIITINKDFAAASVPNMPFRKTDQWVNLSLRRVIRYAAENGFDRIAWTTGEQQADRYDLSKQINQIDYRHENENSVWVDVFDKDDRRIESVSQRYAHNELESTFGKDVANKIINRENLDEEGGNIGSLTGLDLTVGSEGMKAFYDLIIPKIAAELGKPFASSVEPIGIEVPGKLDNENPQYNAPSTEQVMSIPVTQKMKESVMQGVPLFFFAGETGAAALDASQEATTRMDNLNVAREMESASQDPKTIKLATGWERGADGKWRYEVDDFKEVKLSVDQAQQLEAQDQTFTVETPLSDVINDKELFKAYPQLKDYNVTFYEYGKQIQSQAFTDIEKKVIGIGIAAEGGIPSLQSAVNPFARTSRTPKGGIYDNATLRSNLLHEIQHIIQKIEGFGFGANEKELWENLINDKLQEFKEKDWYGHLDESTKRAVAQSNVIKELGYSDAPVSYARNAAYKRVSGEVESRNVQARADMTPEQRRASLLSETEDVSREDQIFLRESGTMASLEPTVKDNPEKRKIIKKLHELESRRLNSSSPKAVIVNSFDDLPIEIQKKTPVKEEKDKKRLKGLFYSGRSYYILDNIHTVDDAVEVWLHEQGVHYGITSLIPDFNERKAFLERIVDDIGLDEIMKVVPEDYIDEYKKGKATNSRAKMTLGDEYMAHLVRKIINKKALTSEQKGIIQRFVEKIRELISKVLNHDIKLTEADVINVAKAAIEQNFTNEKQRLGKDRKFTTNALRQGIQQSTANTERAGFGTDDILRSIFADEKSDGATKMPATITIDGKQRPTTNSNGKPIAATEQGIRNFYKWFGDSKVVDEQGRPLVVYHGSPNKFDKFYANQAQGWGTGIYFTDNMEQAKEEFGDYLYEVYIRLNNPEQNDFNKSEGAIKNTQAWKSFEVKRREKYGDDYEADYYDALQDHIDVINKASREIGIDGIISQGSNNIQGKEIVVFSPTQIKSATANIGTFDGDNADIRFSMAPAAEAKDPKKPTTNDMFKGINANSAIEFATDSFFRWHVLNELVKQRGGVVPEFANVHLHATLQPGKNQAEIEKYESETWKPLEKTISDIQRRTGITLDNLQKYMKAKHAPERNAKLREQNGDNTGEKVYAGSLDGEPLTDEYAEEITLQYEDVIGQDDVKKLWEAMNKATRFSIDKYYESGFITKDTYDELTGDNAYQFYIPLRGWKGETMADIFDYQDADQFKGFQNPFIKAFGRESEADDPLPFIRSMAHTAIISGNKNVFRTKALNLAMLNKDLNDLFTYNSIYTHDTGSKDKEGKAIYEDVVVLSGEVYLFEGYDKDGTIIKDTHLGSYKDLLEEGTMKRTVDYSHYRKNTTRQAKQHEIPVYMAGKKYIVVAKSDPQLALAIEGRNLWNVKGSSETLQKMVELPSTFTRTMSKLLTQYNPAFIPVNFIRDIGYATIAHGVKDQGDIVLFYKNLGKARKAIHRHLRGTADHANNADDRMFERFLLAGGRTGYAFIEDIDAHKKKITKDMLRFMGKSSKWNKVTQSQMIQTSKATMEYMSMMSEDISRYATFLVSKQKGRSDALAAADAKNVTVNFNRKGRVAPFLGMLYAFANAAIQGGANFIGLTIKHKKEMAKVAMSMMVMSYLVAEMMRYVWPDDDEDDNYNNINEFLRDNYMILPNPAWIFGKAKDKYISVPMPHGFRFFWAMGAIASDAAHGKTDGRRAAARVVNNFINTFSPVTVDVGVVGEKGELNARPFVPSWYMPIYDISQNADFADRKVFKEMFTPTLEQSTPEWQKGLKNTNKGFVEFSRALNKIGGGSDNLPANYQVDANGNYDGQNIRQIFNINPAKLEHIVQGYTGGLGQFVNESMKTMVSAVEVAAQQPDAEINVNDIPVLKRLLRTDYKQNRLTDYYELRRQVAATKTMLKALPNEDDKKLLLRMNPENQRREMILKGMDAQMKRFEDMMERAAGDKKAYDEIIKRRDEMLEQRFKELNNEKQE